jgi:hypothetical protein
LLYKPLIVITNQFTCEYQYHIPYHILFSVHFVRFRLRPLTIRR